MLSPGNGWNVTNDERPASNRTKPSPENRTAEDRGRTRIRRWAAPVLAGVLAGVIGTLLVHRLFLSGSEWTPAFTSVPPPDSPDVRVTLSYQLIDALIQRGIDSGESPVLLTNIRTGNSNGRLLIQGNVGVLGQSVTGSVELEPDIDKGVLRMHVHRARLGPLPIPANLERLAERPLNRQIAAALGDLPATLTSVQVGRDGITVTADVRIDEIPFTPR
jgi:hypothetical protein